MKITTIVDRLVACLLYTSLPGRPDDDHHGVAAGVAQRRDRVVDIPAPVRPGEQRLRRAEPASRTRGEDQSCLLYTSRCV